MIKNDNIKIPAIKSNQKSLVDIDCDVAQNSILDDENKYQIWIPAGFAHGFLCLTKFCAVYYKCTNYRNKESEITIKWNDRNLKIK